MRGTNIVPHAVHLPVFPMIADLQAPGVLHRAYHPRVHGCRRGLLPDTRMASDPVLLNAGISRLHRPEIGDMLHGLALIPAQARSRWQSGPRKLSVKSSRSRHSISSDLLFLAAWNKGEIPDLWAFLRARQLRRAGAMPMAPPRAPDPGRSSRPPASMADPA